MFVPILGWRAREAEMDHRKLVGGEQDKDLGPNINSCQYNTFDSFPFIN